MVQHFDDPNLQAAARQLSPGKYIAYVAVNTDFPISDRPWYRCLVRFVGLGMPQDQPDQFVTPDMCVPVFPATEHPAGRRSFQPSKPFPFSNCYLHTWVYATVRFPFRHVDYGDAWEMSVKDMADHRRYMNEDQQKHNMLIEQASPPTKIEPVPSAPSSIVEVTPDTTVGSTGIVKVEDWLKTTDRSHEPLEEMHADDELGPEVSSDDAPDLLPEDEVSPSTPPSEDDTNSLDEVNQLFASVFRPNFSHIDVDVIPMVDFSFDLTEVKELLDPRGFLEEAEAMAELIRKFRAGTLIDVPDSHALPDHSMASRLDDHTISLDSPVAASPTDPLAVLPSNFMVALTSHGDPKATSEQCPSPVPPVSDRPIENVTSSTLHPSANATADVVDCAATHVEAAQPLHDTPAELSSEPKVTSSSPGKGWFSRLLPRCQDGSDVSSGSHGGSSSQKPVILLFINPF
ncbi:hypothetical protein POSPLADRAFT_1055452 [Postia placenta MAD-698-R-SB12]|uniref:Uncharacterized protein n=1 Tax=Postia placenta MAD-698-R-SB12 TaxID=670580 RepID=A0A1X6N4D8_9APHY|nr:hypothetical protein POSPLADRAFT_1055452 [Postia placenta MAD-698-R-SB12]OSX63390.1 hypothetical protein POSPLADRAFT_1055452 [Postia placenta MAD-698-R-SB12]